MKKKLLFWFLLFPTMLMAQNVYYVSYSGGNDQNSGTSTSQPWKSLTKVNSITPNPGDQILFKRGDSWDGTLTINSSGTSGNPITYGAYGTGEKPVIYGSEAITGWSLKSGNIYKAHCTSDISELFLNGEKMKAARFPNTGYATINAVPTSSSLTCNALNGNINYSGAGFACRTNAYVFESNSISSSSGTTLTLSSAPFSSLTVGEGFYLVNKLEFLDSAGEWFYNSTTDTLYFWTPSGNSPANYTVRASVRNYGVYNASKSYININDLFIRQCANSGIYISGSNCTISNNLIEDCNIQAIKNNFGISNTISNNVIRRCNHYGIHFYSSTTSNSTITDNNISEIMVFDDLGLSLTGQWWSGSGIYVESPENIIQYNTITNVGYNGIHFANKNTVQYNFIKDACMVKDDGGGIYTASSDNYPNATNAGSIIRYNIIDNVTGTLEGWSGFTYTYGEGIYLDENSGFVKVLNNTVANCTSSGIFLHNSYNDTITSNTIYNCKNLLSSSISQGGSVLKYNICYAFDRDMQDGAVELNAYEANANDLWDYNKYINHYNSSAFKKSNTVYDFNGWKAATGHDPNSTFDGSPLAAGQVEELFYNETKQTKVFDLGGTVYRDINGQLVSGSLSLEPFTSKILVSEKNSIVSKINNTEASYTGTWNHNSEPGNYNNDRSYSNTVGNYLELEFFGSRIAVFTKTSTTYGKYDVYIDNELVAENIDLSVVINGGYQCKTFEKDDLTDARHTLKCVVKTAGKWCIFDYFETETSGIYKINNTKASYTGTWNHNSEPGNYNNDRSYSNTVGDYLELEFYGYRIAVFTKTSTTYGKYDVYIDDELVAENIDLSVVINGGYQCKTFEKTDLADTRHTLKCVVKTAGKWCIFDYFEAETNGIYKINNTEASYTGTWNHNSEPGNYNNDRSYSNTVGDYLELDFFGRRIAVFTKTSTTYGKYDVYIDDELVAENIDLSVVINGGYQCKTFEKLDLTNTNHTLKCVVKTAGKWCIFDYFEAEGTPQLKRASIRNGITGTGELGNGTLKVVVYPNPSNESISVNVTNLPMDMCVVALYDLQGKLIYENSYKSSSGSINERVDVSRLKSGTYLVYLKSGPVTYQSKLIHLKQ